MSDGRLMREAEAAQYLGLTDGQIRGLREKRRIPTVKVGRSVFYDRRALDRWIDARSVPAKAS